MKTAHAGLAITPGEWEVALGHVRSAIEKLVLTEREQKELLALFLDRKGEIVERA